MSTEETLTLDVTTELPEQPVVEPTEQQNAPAPQATPKKKKNPFKKSLENEAPIFNVVNYIILAILALICFVPFLNLIAKSFSTYGTVVSLLPVKITGDNVGYIFAQVGFYRSLLVSVLVTVAGTVLSVGIMFMAAYPLSKKDLPFRQGFMIFFTVVMLFSGGIIPNFVVMKLFGLLNTPFALIIPSIVQVYNMILLKSNLEAIPGEIEESAYIDGASHGRILVSILLPISLPSIASVSLFTAVTYWNNYFNALLYLPVAKEMWPLALYILESVNAPINQVNPTFKDFAKDNINSAMILVSILPIVCVYPFVLKFFVGGLTVGSVKG